MVDGPRAARNPRLGAGYLPEFQRRVGSWGPACARRFRILSAAAHLLHDTWSCRVGMKSRPLSTSRSHKVQINSSLLSGAALSQICVTPDSSVHHVAALDAMMRWPMAH